MQDRASVYARGGDECVHVGRFNRKCGCTRAVCSCILQWCNSGHWLIDNIHRGKMEKRLEGGDFTKLLWLFKNLCRSRIYKRNISSVALQLVRKMVETLVNFDEIWKDWVDFSRWQCWLICMNEWTIKLKRIDIEIVIFSARFWSGFSSILPMLSYSLGCTRSILQSR